MKLSRLSQVLVALVFSAGALGGMSQTLPASAKPRRVTIVEYWSPNGFPVLRERVAGQLKQMGYVDGQNLGLEIRTLLGLSPEDQQSVLAEVVQSNPDVIVVGGTTAAQLAAKATKEIPIVMWASVDPVSAGLAQSLARPGGNVTGLSSDVGPGAEGKRMELFLDMVPKARRIAFIGNKVSWEDPWGRAVRGVAAQRKVELIFAEGTAANGYADSLEIARSTHAEALFVALGPSTGQFLTKFVDFATTYRLPMSCGITEFADRGCSMAYGQSFWGFITYSMSFVDKILKGAKPGELPIEQPTNFTLVVNQKNAKSIGLQVPRVILLRADRVIE